MAHGFGVTTNELKAIELNVVAQSKGYDTQLNGNTVILANPQGIELTVELVNDAYIVQRIDKRIGYKSIGATIKGIATAFNMLLNESNKRYE